MKMLGVKFNIIFRLKRWNTWNNKVKIFNKMIKKVAKRKKTKIKKKEFTNTLIFKKANKEVKS
jgi:hypothetical protein